MKNKTLVCMAIASALSLGCFALSACRVVTPPVEEHTHTADSEWHTDETSHWHLCTAGDGYEMDKAAHVYDDEQDTTCNTCGYVRTVTPPEEEHTHTADSIWHTDETSHWHLCTAGDGYEMDKDAHVYDDDQDTTCNTCGYVRTVTPPVEEHTHTADSEWHTDETYHWHLCTADDGEQMEKAAHVYDDDQDTACNTCGYVRTIASSDPEPAQPTITSVSASASKTSAAVNDTITLSATVSGTGEYNNTVTWAITEGSSYATLSGNTLTLTGTGIIKVQATANGDNTVKSDEITITSISVTISGDNTVTAGDTLTLTATVKPDSVTEPVSWAITDGSSLATIDSETGVLTAGNSTGTVTVTATVGGVTSAPFGVTINSVVTGDLILTYSYAGNECAAFEWSDATPAEASVKYKLTSEASYTTLDSELIRSASTSGYARADIVGLKGGETYEFVITSSSGKGATVSQSVTAYDRSGYAHFNYTSGVGAYNDDGTPKEDAQIIYVTEETKNTVTAKLGSKTYTGIVAILGGLSSSSNPVIVRVLGTIGAATWNKIDYNADKTYSGSNLMPEEVVVGINGEQLPTNSNTTQADLIDGGYNTLNTTEWSELIGLDSRAKYSGGEYDTIWNNCPIKSASNVTLEGIGEDARLFQWGLTWQYCNSIEVRNLTFEDYTEDACSFEGSVASTTVDGFNSQRIWLHHNTFEEGINYWDLSAEQDKHEGDGATDFKQLSYLTSSYNVHHNNHKTGLVGGSDSTKTACVTFHHNYYNNNTSRLPLGRQANMHMYNNYYYKSTGTNMSIRAGAYAFIENCYFEDCSTPIEIKTGDSKTGAVKLYQNVFSGKSYTANSYIYEVTDRTKAVENDNIYNKTFDTDSSAFYYDSTNKVTDVSVMYTAEETKQYVPLLAGVQKRNGTTAIDPEGGSTGGGSGSESGSESGGESGTIPTYSQLLAREDIIYSDDFSTYSDGYKFAELTDYNTAGVYSIPKADSTSTQTIATSYTQVSGGKTNQVTNGANTVTAVAFGDVSTVSVIQGYFEIATTDIGTKWDIIRFVNNSSGSVFAVRIDADKTKALTYTVSGGTATTPSESFVFAKDTTYKVYFKIDVANGTITVNITDGTNEFSVESISIGTNTVSGLNFTTSNSGQRFTAIDNLVICAS